MLVDGSGATVVADYAISSTEVTRSTPAGFGGARYSSVASLLLISGSGANRITVNSTSPNTTPSFATDAGDDTIELADGVSLNGGTIDGGGDNDTLSYAAFTTGVRVNLGMTSNVLGGVLDSTQRVPLGNFVSIGNSVANLFYDPATNTFDLNVGVTGLAGLQVTSIMMRRGAVGESGPLVVLLTNLGTRTDTPGGFDYNVTGVSLPPLQEAALLGGLIYLEFGIAPENGVIRTNLQSTGNVPLITGWASGTGGIASIENVSGGSGADSLVGSFALNTLSGNAGDDTLLGGPGNDSFNGDGGADAITYNSGDASDVIDGGSDGDLLQVNGSLSGPDVMQVSANGARVNVANASLPSYSLDVGTIETLVLAPASGDDTLILGSLIGVTDLTTVQLSALTENDTFNVTPAPTGPTRNIRVNGGAQSIGDTMNVNLTGVSNPVLSLDGSGNGTFSASSHQSISVTSIESAPGFSPQIFRDSFE
ncbi:MAG: hypothetical protein IPK97_08700 [Ahniella sp.]|nr:hypothetical protein [Ahniella sp.]